MNEYIITVVDIGSSKIVAMSGAVKDNGITIIGTESITPAEEIIRKGKVIDMENLSNYLFEAFESLKEKTGSRVEWVNLGVGGGHMRGRLFQKQIPIEPGGRAIEESDIQNLDREIRMAVAEMTQQGTKVLARIHQEYIVDGRSTTKKKPIGMHGDSLRAKCHILTGAVNPLQDLIKCVKNAGPAVERIFPHSWASAEAVTTEEARKMGVLVLDCGKGTTDICCYYDDVLMMTDSFPVGGGTIDNDLSVLLNTPIGNAENLKKAHGWCSYEPPAHEQPERASERIDVFTPAGKLGKQTTAEEISRIVSERIRDLYERILAPAVMKASLEDKPLLKIMGGGIVLTGGTAYLKDLPKFTEEFFRHPVRIGTPKKIPGMEMQFLKPEYAAAVGLLLLSEKEERKRERPPKFKPFFWVKEKIREIIEGS